MKLNNSNIPWEVRYHPDAQKELDRLDGSVRKIVLAGIKKVSANPVSKDDGGYGKPLGNKGENNLTGYFKIKYRKIGIRVVYKLIIEVKKDGSKVMYILVISARADNEIYNLAGSRK